MKINSSKLNPLYDQYSNQENRLTHALLHTIGSSQWLFSKFLKNIIGIKAFRGKLIYEISTQKVPFSLGDNDPEKVESIPDAWIVDESWGIGIAIEVKDKKKSLCLDQLRKHADRIKEYTHKYLLVITPDLKEPDKIKDLRKKESKWLNIVWKSWDDIYRWLIDLPITKSSKYNKEEFLISSMIEYLERRREVLGFQGIYFKKGFDVEEAKKILNAEMEALESTVKRIYKDLGKRRKAITTFSKKGVWDCFGSEKGFTSDMHITLEIDEESHLIALTIPNSAKQGWTRLKNIFSEDVKLDRLFSILDDLRKEVPHLYIEFNQRHFIAQKFGIRDGYMEFDIDTLGAPFRKKQSKTKEFPIWLPYIRDAILNKRKINGQVMFKSNFYLNETSGINKANFIKNAKNTIKAFKPLYQFLKK